jgi:hypothetical protein
MSCSSAGNPAFDAINRLTASGRTPTFLPGAPPEIRDERFKPMTRAEREHTAISLSLQF